MKSVPLLLLALLVAAVRIAPAAPPDRDGPEAEIEGWIGQSAMQLRVASIARLPLMPTERSVTTSLLLIETHRNGDGLVQQHRVCDVRVDGSSRLVRTVVPPGFLRNLAPRSYPAVLREAGDTLHYRADMGLEAIGFDPQLTDGELPDGANAPGVRDTDGDGDLGATVELRVPAFGRVRLFIAQRSHLVLQGIQTEPERIEGEVDIHLLEQRTLGAEPGFFNRTPAIRPDSPRSGFTLIRVPDTLDCAGLRDRAETLFG